MQRLEREDREAVWHTIKTGVGGHQASGPASLVKWEPLKDFKI